MDKLQAKKSLGQNFLVDKNISRKIANLLGLNVSEKALEIGPGEGSLTEYLLETGACLKAVEIDERAVELLKKRFPQKDFPNFELIHQDFAKFKFDEHYSYEQPVKVAGNIPYYLSSEILFKLFENANIVSAAVITMQKEVAQRLIAGPGSKTYGILSIAGELTCKRKIAFDIPPHCFRPAPKVMSSVVLMEFNKSTDLSLYYGVMKLVKAAFNQRRKKISNSLSTYMQNMNIKVVDKINDEKIKSLFDKRPEQLYLHEFIDLYTLLNQ